MGMQGNDSELLILALLINSLSYEDDPFLGDMIYERLCSRLKRSELFDPEIDHFLRRRFHHPNNLRERRLSEAREVAVSVLEGFRKSFEESTSKKINYNYEHLQSIIKEVKTLEQRHELMQKNVHSFLTMQSLGIELKLIPLHRFIPLRVFLSKADSEQVANISKAIERVLTVFGFEFSDEFPEITGSWFKKWFAKTKEVITEPELSERLEKIERAIEIKGLHKPQSEIDKNQAEAIATLIKALEVVPNATINCGSILLVKTNDEKNDFCIQARTLTQKEMVCLEKNQNILKSPHDVLEKLSKISNEQSDIEMQKTKDIFCQIIYYIMKRTKKLKKIILAMKVQTVNHHVIH